MTRKNKHKKRKRAIDDEDESSQRAAAGGDTTKSMAPAHHHQQKIQQGEEDNESNKRKKKKRKKRKKGTETEGLKDRSEELHTNPSSSDSPQSKFFLCFSGYHHERTYRSQAGCLLQFVLVKLHARMTIDIMDKKPMVVC